MMLTESSQALCPFLPCGTTPTHERAEGERDEAREAGTGSTKPKPHAHAHMQQMVYFGRGAEGGEDC